MKSNEVHEVFRYLVERNIREPEFLDQYLRYFDRVKWMTHFARLFSPAVKACFPREGKRFVFYSSKFSHVMEGLDSSSLMLFGKPQDIPFAVKHSIAFYPIYDIIPELFALFRSDPRLESCRAAKFIDNVTSMLFKMNPEYLVVWNDSLFLERLLVFCGRRAGVKSICIQHGIFHDAFNREFLDGHYADYMFVWGKSQADLYGNCGFAKEKLKVMGYPYRVENASVGKHEKVVCILGENIETLNKELGLKKKQVYEAIADLLRSNNFRVIYKPHPFETDRNFIPANLETVAISLSDAFDNYSMFVALTSTALLEATLHGKIAVQYYDDCFGGCDFSLRGFSYTARTLAEIPLLLSSRIVPSAISPDALLLCEHPAQQFLATVELLEVAG